MAIKNGRNGQVLWDATGAGTPAPIVGLNDWKLDNTTKYEDVTCWGDTNIVYCPGFMDVKGSFAGFWDSTELALFTAAVSGKPGTLQLMPNSTEPTMFWQGQAYLDASIDCSLNAPKVTGTFQAAGSWTIPPGTGSLGATKPGDSLPGRIVLGDGRVVHRQHDGTWTLAA